MEYSSCIEFYRELQAASMQQTICSMQVNKALSEVVALLDDSSFLTDTALSNATANVVKALNNFRVSLEEFERISGRHPNI